MYLQSANNLDIKEIEAISQELEYLGLPEINKNVDVPNQLIKSIELLLRAHKQILSDNKDLRLQNAILQKELSAKISTISAMKRETERQNDLNHSQNLKELKVKNQLVISKDKILELENTVGWLKISLASKEQSWKIAQNKLKLENEDLKVPKEELTKYKRKEQIYKETICKLQENNENLLAQLGDLEQEVLKMTTESSTL